MIVLGLLVILGLAFEIVDSIFHANPELTRGDAG